MNGQWMGRFTGSNSSGLIVVDLDDRETHYEGTARLYHEPMRHDLPHAIAFIKTPGKARSYRLKNVPILPIDPRTGDPVAWNIVASLYPATSFPPVADIGIAWTNKRLSVKWTTALGTAGFAELPKSQAMKPSEYAPLPSVQSWNDFRRYANGLEYR